MPKEQAIPYFAVLAMRRDDWSEAIVGLNRLEADARRFGQKVAAAWPLRFVRCRVRPMHLTPSQVRAICREWGRVDALAGVPLRPTNFPKSYDAAYRRGHRAGLAEARKAGDGVVDGSRRNGHEE
jgi:hypothetical protein